MSSDETSAGDLLILGGTSWLGGAVARHALARGHRVTCVARGEAGPAPEGVTWVPADRAEPSAYDAVADQEWDAVLDVSWQPGFVRSALTRLAPHTRHWIYVSSCSVYADHSVPGEDETATLHAAYQGQDPVDWPVYGPAKVACEEACLATMGADHTLIARAGLIGGYGDRSDRLGYWPGRVARSADGSPVLVPPRDTPVQVVDVEDLAGWLVEAAERRTAGVMNALGDETTLGAVLEASVATSGQAPRFLEASHAWLAGQEVEPWMGPESLPLWLPQPEYAGFMTRRNDAAKRAGLAMRPLQNTVAAALLWEQECGLERNRGAGLTPQRERLLLDRLASSTEAPGDE